MAIREIFYKNHNFNISYEIINPDKSIDFIVLHGWGSNKEIMKQAFGNKMKNFRHIYIDLPGFGKSSNDIILNTQDYANIIKIFLQDIKAKTDIIMGHSFGGKVALLLNPNILVLLSSAGIVEKKSLKVQMKIIIFKIFKNMGLSRMYKIFVSKDAQNLSKNMYETFKNVINEDFSKQFKDFSKQALIFWGKDDKTTPLSSGKQIHFFIKNSKFYSLSGNHFFFLKQGEFISHEILRSMI